jgi:hypothetical protein
VRDKPDEELRDLAETQEIKEPYYFCTYFDRNYLGRGLALYDSLRRHCKRPFRLWVLCFDEESYSVLIRLGLENVQPLSVEEFERGDDALASAKAERTRVEYYWTCTPSLPLYILRHNPQVEVITYLDADLYFYSDPEPIYQEFGQQSVLIIGHRFAAQYTHLAEGAGIYNVGLLAFRRDSLGLSALRWWRERCLEWCYARVEEGKFGDQKYLDDWPERFQGVWVLRHKGAGLAPWNLPRYSIEFHDGGVGVDGEPLIFYHFHGYQRINRWISRPAGLTYRFSTDQIGRLYLPYAAALRKAERKVASILMGSKPEHMPMSARELTRGIRMQHLFLVHPRIVALFLWELGGWLHAGAARFRKVWTGHSAR